jgi:wyosine [tRNA(Phe)-imidazoG37] synthetase (radical SAM superfamily)
MPQHGEVKDFAAQLAENRVKIINEASESRVVLHKASGETNAGRVNSCLHANGIENW